MLRGRGVPGFMVFWFFGFLVFGFLVFISLVSWFQSFLVSMFLGFKVSWFLGFKVSNVYQMSISCFLEYIDPISTVFKILLDGASRFIGAHRPQQNELVDFRNLEIYKNNIFQNRFGFS